MLPSPCLTTGILARWWAVPSIHRAYSSDQETFASCHWGALHTVWQTSSKLSCFYWWLVILPSMQMTLEVWLLCMYSVWVSKHLFNNLLVVSAHQVYATGFLRTPKAQEKFYNLTVIDGSTHFYSESLQWGYLIKFLRTFLPLWAALCGKLYVCSPWFENTFTRLSQ